MHHRRPDHDVGVECGGLREDLPCARPPERTVSLYQFMQRTRQAGILIWGAGGVPTEIDIKADRKGDPAEVKL